MQLHHLSTETVGPVYVLGVVLLRAIFISLRLQRRKLSVSLCCLVIVVSGVAERIDGCILIAVGSVAPALCLLNKLDRPAFPHHSKPLMYFYVVYLISSKKLFFHLLQISHILFQAICLTMVHRMTNH